MPPDEEELYNRLKNRNTETEENIQVRLETARKELAEKDIYDYKIVNETGKSKEASDKIYKIMRGRNCGKK